MWLRFWPPSYRLVGTVLCLGEDVMPSVWLLPLTLINSDLYLSHVPLLTKALNWTELKRPVKSTTRLRLIGLLDTFVKTWIRLTALLQLLRKRRLISRYFLCITMSYGGTQGFGLPDMGTSGFSIYKEYRKCVTDSISKPWGTPGLWLKEIWLTYHRYYM